MATPVSNTAIGIPIITCHHDNQWNYFVSAGFCDWAIATPPYVCVFSQVK